MEQLKLHYHWPWIAWLVGVVVLTGVPGTAIPHVISFSEWLKPDKIVHIILFGGLVFLALRSMFMQYHQNHPRYLYSIVIVLGITTGGITEVLQEYVFQGRDGNIFDFGADVFGCFTGLMVFQLIKRKILKKRQTL